MNATETSRSQLVLRESRWFALYTRYKREKLVHQRLKEKGVNAYLPLQKLTRRYGNRVRHVELPLISCYVFTKITLKEYVNVLQTEDVVDFVKFSNDMIAIPEGEIDLLQRIVEGGYDVEVESSAYQVGDRVEIVGGHLTGTKGILVERKDKKNFLVELNEIGYSLRMSVAPNLLRRVGYGGASAPG